MKKLSRFQKTLFFSGAAILLVLVCLLLSPEPEPYAGIPNDQWIEMCREAYDDLYQKEFLHFTQNRTETTPSNSTAVSAEIWFSGDNFFQRETRENGDLRAYLLKDGTYYSNVQKELAPAEWKTSAKDPVFVRSTGTWSDAGYALSHFDRNGQQAEVIFSREVLLPNDDRLRMHYLTFRFDRDLNLTAIVYAYIVYDSDKIDPNSIYISQTTEYIFHDTQKDEIASVLDAPLQIMEAHRAEAEKWASIAAAVYEELCSRTFLHYTYTTTQQDEEHTPGYTAQCEGWYSGTDSVTEETRVGQITRTYIRIQKGSVYCKKTIRSEEDSGWDVEEREPSMHGRYQHKWPEDTYTFYSAEAVDTGMDLTFWRVTSPPHHSSQIPGITVITFHLDAQARLCGITVAEITDNAGNSWFDNEPSTVSEYCFLDTSEAQILAEIDKYYKQATSGN